MKTFRLALLLLSSPLALAQTPQITMGNGEANWIHTEGAKRQGPTFVFPEVRIDGSGWLVLHPFKDGKPNGKVVAGYSKIPSGTSSNVEVSVDPAPEAGDLFVVMLHSDANRNDEFDFVFINEREVIDRAVFEGATMIGHVYAAP
ncbi:MAG: hypothetical protein AAF671_09440 [Pseudomonadota bacterium]